MQELNLKKIEKFFESIKSDDNLNDILLIEEKTNREKKQIYEYLKNNDVLYAGGEMSNSDVEKVRNVMIKLWLKADENNKKYGRSRWQNE